MIHLSGWDMMTAFQTRSTPRPLSQLRSPKRLPLLAVIQSLDTRITHNLIRLVLIASPRTDKVIASWIRALPFRLIWHYWSANGSGISRTGRLDLPRSFAYSTRISSSRSAIPIAFTSTGGASLPCDGFMRCSTARRVKQRSNVIVTHTQSAIRCEQIICCRSS